MKASVCFVCLNRVKDDQKSVTRSLSRVGRAGRKAATITTHAPGTCPPAKL